MGSSGYVDTFAVELLLAVTHAHSMSYMNNLLSCLATFGYQMSLVRLWRQSGLSPTRLAC